MAYCRFNVLPEMEELTEQDLNDCLFEGVKILVPEIKRNLKRTVKGNSEKGLPEDEKAHLAENLYAQSMCNRGVVRQRRNGRVRRYKNKPYAEVTFAGTVERTNKRNNEKRTVRRNEIAAVLEYGKPGQLPTYFLRNSLSSKTDEIQAAMNRKFKEIVERKQNKGGN